MSACTCATSLRLELSRAARCGGQASLERPFAKADLAINCVFFVDILLNFRTAYMGGCCPVLSQATLQHQTGPDVLTVAALQRP
jgi:hypothetical protein